jgi:hypothetical protein
MTPEEGKWILLFGAIAWSTHVIKVIALYILLWRSREEGRKRPMQLMAFLFLLAILSLLPYQEPKGSKAMNRFLIVATILQYTSWLAIAYIILIRG